MTDELIRQLMTLGLTKSQASSVTAETLVKLFMDEDSSILIHEAERQVCEMRSLVNELKNEYEELKQNIESISDAFLAIDAAQVDHGTITEERAKNVVALYGALLSMNERAGSDPNESIKNAGYIVYAYLGGQAKREITYSPE